MSIQAVLWRVLLCFSVILNGSALASTSMPMPSPLHQQPVARMTADSVRPSMHPACHDQAMGTAIVAAHPHTPSSPMPGKHAPPDCCPAGACGCVCVQSQAGIAITGLDRLVMHAMTANQARARHDEPVLPHLIRPPIG